MIFNRKDIRNQLANLLQGHLAELVQEIYAYMPIDFSNQSPVIYMTSSSSDRTMATSRTPLSKFKINLHIAVKHTDAENNWTEQNAEDKLDDIEAAVYDFIVKTQVVSGYWAALDYLEPSNADDPMVVGGVPYLHEAISLQVVSI